MGEHDQDRVFEGTEELQTLAASESRCVKILTWRRHWISPQNLLEKNELSFSSIHQHQSKSTDVKSTSINTNQHVNININSSQLQHLDSLHFPAWAAYNISIHTHIGVS
jgi:hypothetical protein